MVVIVITNIYGYQFPKKTVMVINSKQQLWL